MENWLKRRMDETDVIAADTTVADAPRFGGCLWRLYAPEGYGGRNVPSDGIVE